jgi:hypothetical protein
MLSDVQSSAVAAVKTGYGESNDNPYRSPVEK